MSNIQQMGNGAVYSIIFSPTGGTKKVADILMENISEGAMGNEIDLCNPGNNL